VQVGTCWWSSALCSVLWLFVHPNCSGFLQIAYVTFFSVLTAIFCAPSSNRFFPPVLPPLQRWTALPGEPPPLDDTDVDDWLPRFVVLNGPCIFFYLLSTGNRCFTYLPCFICSVPMHLAICRFVECLWWFMSQNLQLWSRRTAIIIIPIPTLALPMALMHVLIIHPVVFSFSANKWW